MSVFRRGLKRELFLGEDPVENEEQEQKAKRAELYGVWVQPKDGPAKDMSIGEWLPELRLICVQQQRGNILNHMGFIWRSKLHLFVEEALYLMDRGSLILLREGSNSAIVSLQEGYGLMAASGCSMERYIVYTHLMRCGYYVKRYPAVWTLQDDACKDSPASALTSLAWEYPWLPGGTEGADAGSAGPAAAAVSDEVGAAEAEPMSTGAGEASGAAEGGAIFEQQGRSPAAAAEAAEGEAIVEQHRRSPAAAAEGAAEGEAIVEQQGGSPAAAAVGGDVELSVELLYGSSRRTREGVGGGGGCRPSAPDGADDEPGGASREGGRGCWWAGLGEAHPWLPIPEAEAASLLPTCEVLTAPEEERGGACISATDVFPSINLNCGVPPTEVSHLVFDVLRPNSKLNRKSPSEPFKRVCIARSPPTFSDARAALDASSPCPVLFALVEDGVVTLYDTTVPCIENYGRQGHPGRGGKSKGKWRRGGNKNKKAKQG